MRARCIAWRPPFLAPRSRVWATAEEPVEALSAARFMAAGTDWPPEGVLVMFLLLAYRALQRARKA